jgi:uncharacterized protein (TIGR04255 family)
MCITMCNMVLDFDHVGHPQQPLLRKAPLVLTACQLRFPLVLGFSDELVRPLQVELGADYPDVEIQALQQVQFGPVGITVTGDAQRMFRFHSHRKDWVVTVAPNALSLETTAYKGFRDFVGRWQQVAAACVKALDLEHQERIGLRYVNELAAPEQATHEDLLSLVRKDLLGPIGAHPATTRVFKAWQELRFTQDAGALTLQHGYAQRPPKGWAYVLDFDHYDDEGKAIDLESQVNGLAQFNHRTYELFAWAVNEELFESFEPEVQ